MKIDFGGRLFAELLRVLMRPELAKEIRKKKATRARRKKK